MSKKKYVEFNINGEIIKKHFQNSYIRKLREDSLKKRTKHELQAEDILKKHFQINYEFVVEYPFQFRRFDFYFPLIKLALEIDGGYHSNNFQKEYDNCTDEYLKSNYEITVLRIKNEDLQKLHNYILKIKELLENKRDKKAKIKLEEYKSSKRKTKKKKKFKYDLYLHENYSKNEYSLMFKTNDELNKIYAKSNSSKVLKKIVDINEKRKSKLEDKPKTILRKAIKTDTTLLKKT